MKVAAKHHKVNAPQRSLTKCGKDDKQTQDDTDLQNSTAAVVVPTMTEAAMAGQLTIGSTVVPGGAPLATCITAHYLATALSGLAAANTCICICQGLLQLILTQHAAVPGPSKRRMWRKAQTPESTAARPGLGSSTCAHAVADDTSACTVTCMVQGQLLHQEREWCAPERRALVEVAHEYCSRQHEAHTQVALRTAACKCLLLALPQGVQGTCQGSHRVCNSPAKQKDASQQGHIGRSQHSAAVAGQGDN